MEVFTGDMSATFSALSIDIEVVAESDIEAAPVIELVVIEPIIEPVVVEPAIAPVVERGVIEPLVEPFRWLLLDDCPLPRSLVGILSSIPSAIAFAILSNSWSNK